VVVVDDVEVGGPLENSAELADKLATRESPAGSSPPLGRVAFVYPGSGNAHLGMGRALALMFPSTVAALTGWLAERDLDLGDLRAGRQRLEDVFLRLTESADQAEADPDGPDGPGARGRRRRSGRSTT